MYELTIKTKVYNLFNGKWQFINLTTERLGFIQTTSFDQIFPYFLNWYHKYRQKEYFLFDIDQDCLFEGEVIFKQKKKTLTWISSKIIVTQTRRVRNWDKMQLRFQLALNPLKTLPKIKLEQFLTSEHNEIRSMVTTYLNSK